MQLNSILAGFLTALAISIIAIPSIIKVAIGKGLYGINRKKNAKEQKVPTLGGLAIFAGIIVSLNLYADVSDFPELPYITAGMVGLFFIGLKDDILVTAPWWKLLGQLLVALVICIPGGLIIEGAGSFLGLPAGGASLEVLLTVILIITIINAYNFIDGIDGLAAGIGILASLVYGLVFWWGGLDSWALMSVASMGSLAGFTWYNVFSRRKKIYMGDTGSLVLGFLLSLMTVRVLNMETPLRPFMEIHTPAAFIIAVLIIPLFDAIRIIIIRIWKGRSPFRPDRLHIHYRLEDRGLKHSQVTGILLGVNLLMIILVAVGQRLGEVILIISMLIVACILSLLPGVLSKKQSADQDDPA